MKLYLQQAGREERESLAKAVQSSVGYFYLIAGRHRRPGTELCKSLVEHEPRLTLHELRPDIWSPVESLAQVMQPSSLEVAKSSDDILRAQNSNHSDTTGEQVREIGSGCDHATASVRAT